MIRAAYDAFNMCLLEENHCMLMGSPIQIHSPYFPGEDGAVELSSRDILSSYQQFLNKVEKAFCGQIKENPFLMLSDKLKAQFYERLQDPRCMLPSFNHRLPSGKETGTFIALDLGGSNLRVALIKLSGKGKGDSEINILSQKTFRITSHVRNLKGPLFFNWMAERVEETLLQQKLSNGVISVGVSWSFPIQQTSLQNGLLMKMGKGFSAADVLLKHDLGMLIRESCQKRGLNVQLDAITNDSTATLLSKAYLDAATQFALILGTGMNAAVYLPTHLFTPSKFGARSPEWHASAEYIIVNTEISMMGHDFLPATEWDKILKSHHPNPDFQPLELMVSGKYLGEIVRLILIDGIKTAGLFGGIVPISLRDNYSLDTETISKIERDESPTQAAAYKILSERHPSTIEPTKRDMHALRFILSHVIYRASGLVAAGIHALWQFCNEVRSIAIEDYTKIIVACDGSVIESYPGFKLACQEHLDSLVQASGGKRGMVQLVHSKEGSLVGAAVASAIAFSGK